MLRQRNRMLERGDVDADAQPHLSRERDQMGEDRQRLRRLHIRQEVVMAEQQVVAEVADQLRRCDPLVDPLPQVLVGEVLVIDHHAELDRHGGSLPANEREDYGARASSAGNDVWPPTNAEVRWEIG